MAIGDRQIFVTPPPEDLVVKKLAVDGKTCPECGGGDIRRYPVGDVKGPRMVVKCQACFHQLAVERPAEEDNWPPFRAVAYSWDPSPSERASAR